MYYIDSNNFHLAGNTYPTSDSFRHSALGKYLCVVTSSGIRYFPIDVSTDAAGRLPLRVVLNSSTYYVNLPYVKGTFHYSLANIEDHDSGSDDSYRIFGPSYASFKADDTVPFQYQVALTFNVMAKYHGEQSSHVYSSYHFINDKTTASTPVDLNWSFTPSGGYNYIAVNHPSSTSTMHYYWEIVGTVSSSYPHFKASVTMSGLRQDTSVALY